MTGLPWIASSFAIFFLLMLLAKTVWDKRVLEVRVAKSEAYYKSITASETVGTMVCSLHGAVFEVNDTFLGIIGYTRADLEAGCLRWDTITPSEYVEIDRQKVEELLQTGFAKEYEKQFFHKDGHRVDVWLEGISRIEGTLDLVVCCFLDITEQKRIEHSLVESEARFSRVVEGSNDGYWDWDLEKGQVFWSDRLFEMLGETPRDNFVPFGIFESHLSPSDEARVSEAIQASIKSGTPLHIEFQMRHQQGYYIDCLSRGKPYYNEKGEVIRLAGMLSDVTEQKRIQAALLKSEARFRQLSDSNLLGVAFWNIYGKIYEANDTFLSILGYGRDDLETGLLNWQILTLPEDQRAHAERVQKAIQGATVLPYETRFIHKEGHKIDVLVGYAMLEGSKEQGFVFVLDISERKQVEQALREREERYRLLSHAANDTIWDWNLLTDEVEWNEQFFSVFHYKPEQVEHTSGWWVKHIHPEDRDRINASIQSLFDKGGDTWTGEYRYLCGDGVTSKTVLDRGFVIHNEQGKPVRMLGSMLDLTAQKQYEQRVKTIAESMPNKMWIALPSGEVEYVNQRWVDYTGIQVQAVRDFDSSQLIYPEDRETISQAWHSCILSKKNLEAQVRLRRCDGMYRWHLVQGIPLLDSKGDIEQIVGSLTDIQEMKEIQSSLMESEERFRSLADSVPFLIWLSDNQGQNIYTNKTCSDFTGGPKETFANQNWLTFIHPEDRDMTIQVMMKAIEDKESYRYQYRALRHDGQYRWMQVIGLPRFTSAGELTGYVGSAFDITEQKEINQILETRIQERTQQLQKSNSLLASIVENVPAMIFLKDAQSLRFELFNKAGKELIGFTDAQLLGKNDYDFFPKEQAEFFIAKDRETLERGMLVDVYEEPLQTMHGDLRYLHTKKVPIMDEQGKPAYLLGISEDITELKKSQEQVHSLNCQLEDQIRNLNAVNKELESFSYTVSHDLRAPLRTIDGFSQAVLEDYGDQLDAEGKRYLMRVREGSQQMAQLIDDMLNLSRLTRGVLKKETFSLSEMVRSIATDLQANNPERQVRFVIQEGLHVEADKRLIQTVMENLIGNAWKFTSHHKTALIEFGGALEKDRMVYFVKDDGAGFDMAYADKLFGTFQRLHNTAEFKGTGVGLVSVQRVIHRHGGEIWARGEVEEGAIFYFTL